MGARAIVHWLEARRALRLVDSMFTPNWSEGPYCSFWAGSFDGIDVHLHHRDTTFVAVSRAALDNLAAYTKRMGSS